MEYPKYAVIRNEGTGTWCIERETLDDQGKSKIILYDDIPAYAKALNIFIALVAAREFIPKKYDWWRATATR